MASFKALAILFVALFAVAMAADEVEETRQKRGGVAYGGYYGGYPYGGYGSTVAVAPHYGYGGLAGYGHSGYLGYGGLGYSGYGYPGHYGLGYGGYGHGYGGYGLGYGGYGYPGYTSGYHYVH